MKALEVFKLEEYLGQYEFKAKHMIAGSDMQTISLKELLEISDPESRRLWEELHLGYTETEGHSLLREEISKLYAPAVTADHILCFAGAEEAIYCMAHEILNESDHAVVVTPCYQSLKSLPQSLCEVSEVPLSFEEEWQLNLNAIRAAIRPNTRLIIINFPHNPTGITISKQQQQELIHIAREQDAYLFSDEVYRFMEIDEADRLAPIVDGYEKGLSLGVMSKSYGLAGLRVGWIASHDQKLLHALNQRKHYLSICNSGPSEILTLMALRAADVILKRNLTLIQSNLEHLTVFFGRYSGLLSWVAPQGGCIGFPRFHDSSVNILDVANSLVKHEGCLILPGSVYDVSQPHFRIGFGRTDLEAGLERLEAGLNRYFGI